MPDTITPVFGLVLQTVGGNRNTWGGINNANFLRAETAIAGLLTKVVTGGSITLTETERRNRIMKFTGTLTATQTVVMANVPQEYVIINDTTGNFGLLIKTASGDPVNAPRACVRRIVCDGDDHMYREDRDKVGEFFDHAGAAVPGGALECNGGTPLRVDYPDLWIKMGTVWGPGNGTTNMQLPNQFDTGRFRRSRTASVQFGNSQSNTLKQHNHTATGSTSVTIAAGGTHNHGGSAQVNDHAHTYLLPNGFVAIPQGAGSQILAASHVNAGTVTGGVTNTVFASIPTEVDHGHPGSTASTTVTVNNAGDTETRPEAIVCITCVRY